jgi:hypothetical protein
MLRLNWEIEETCLLFANRLALFVTDTDITASPDLLLPRLYRAGFEI